MQIIETPIPSLQSGQVLIRTDYSLISAGGKRAPALQRDIGLDQHLPLGIRYPLGDPDRQPKPIGSLSIVSRHPRAEDRHFLAVPGLTHTAGLRKRNHPRLVFSSSYRRSGNCWAGIN